MPIVLAIETSTELASAALLCGDRVISRETSGVHMHSQNILPMVHSILAEAGMTIGRCDAIAFGAGPGSFTGVRTACGIAQGLAFGQDLPLIPIVTLQAMAQACRRDDAENDVLSVLDARMGEVYWAQYRYSQGWHTILEPKLSSPGEVLPVGRVLACGNGFSAYASAFRESVFAQQARHQVMPHAKHVVQLAALAFADGIAVAARDAQPLYLRNKVALTTVERAAKVAP